MTGTERRQELQQSAELGPPPSLLMARLRCQSCSPWRTSPWQPRSARPGREQHLSPRLEMALMGNCQWPQAAVQGLGAPPLAQLKILVHCSLQIPSQPPLLCFCFPLNYPFKFNFNDVN